MVEASRRPELFCSGWGTTIVDMPAALRGSMLDMDDPRHGRLRRVVSEGFTPRHIQRLLADVESIAAGIVDQIAARGECEFVADVAGLLPLRVILDLMGIPRSEEQFVFDRTNTIAEFTDPQFVANQGTEEAIQTLFDAYRDLAGLVRELGQARLRDPRDDLITLLMTSEVDDGRLTSRELESFFSLLVTAGSETTRNAIAHGLWLLTAHPDQRARWMADPPGMTATAVEEVLRVACPVLHFRRTVTRDGAQLGDHEFSEGDKVVLWYWSANRDEDVFDDPGRFDVARTPNDHLSFGGPGPHFCLGAHLARREISVMFQELFKRLPDIHAVGDPEPLRSNFLNGIKHLRAEFTPA